MMLQVSYGKTEETLLRFAWSAEAIEVAKRQEQLGPWCFTRGEGRCKGALP